MFSPSSFALVAVLSAASPNTTGWTQSGAQSWHRCEALRERILQAWARQEPLESTRSSMRAANRCPHQPEVLLQSAIDLLVDSAALGTSADPDTAFDSQAKQLETNMRRILAWTEQAIDEAHRRSEQPPLGVYYYRAYAFEVLRRPDASRDALARSIVRAEVPRWRTDFLGALVAMQLGEIDQALRLAHRGVLDAPPGEQMTGKLVFALALDRAGAFDSVEDELGQANLAGDPVRARLAVSSALPFAERLYFLAIVHQARGDRSNAIRFWQAYLARPEPAPPDRELARRHFESLAQRPPPVQP
jgi:tetratricopeptide (TPR) repeat protein